MANENIVIDSSQMEGAYLGVQGLCGLYQDQF